jgi:hypothetical protein
MQPEVSAGQCAANSRFVMNLRNPTLVHWIECS